MNVRLELVPYWRKAYRLLSVQATAVSVVLASIQLTASEMQGNAFLGDIVAAPWFKKAMVVVSLLAIALRFLKQPAVVPVATEAPPAQPS